MHLGRFAGAEALSEVMLKMAPPAPLPGAYETFIQGLDALATQGRGVLSEREADALALEAQRWARKPRRRARTRRK